MAVTGFIGGGNMGEALIKGIISARLYPPEDILVSDVRPDRLDYLRQQYGITPIGDNRRLAERADVIVLSIKPQNMDEVLDGIKDSLRDGATVISIAAGITIDRLIKHLGDIAVVRAMPNTPAMVGEGATAMVTRNASPAALKAALEIFMAAGSVEVLTDESLIDAVTAISGSGPAYFFLLMEQMIETAKKLGLSPEIAQSLVIQTAKGAARLADLASAKNETPDVLRQRVTSPGGTTQAALNVFEELGFGMMVAKALTAARDRGRELSA